MKIRNAQEFNDRMRAIYNECADISFRKNADYSEVDAPFKNFHGVELYGASAELGIVVRLSDKFMRITNLLRRTAMVADEKIADTIKDAINYLAILLMLIEDRQARREEAPRKVEVDHLQSA